MAEPPVSQLPGHTGRWGPQGLSCALPVAVTNLKPGYAALRPPPPHRTGAQVSSARPCPTDVLCSSPSLTFEPGHSLP